MSDTNLTAIFQSVSAALAENQTMINQADSVHHDHGDDMVEIFNVITGAVKKKKAYSTSAQLRYAGKLLEEKGRSGTSQVYANNLKQASKKYKGKEINENSAIDFIQTLMGGQAQPSNPASDDGDMLSSLLSSVMGGQAQPSNPANNDSDMLGSLLSSVMGGQTTAQPSDPATDLLSGASQEKDDKFDLSDVLQIGMGYLNAKQSGSSNFEALAATLLNRTQMGQKEHRAASGQIVVQSLLNGLKQFAR